MLSKVTVARTYISKGSGYPCLCYQGWYLTLNKGGDYTYLCKQGCRLHHPLIERLRLHLPMLARVALSASTMKQVRRAHNEVAVVI